MYDEIRKPRLLKDVPTVFIRSLPSLYYFNKYADTKILEQAKLLFDSNVDYLHEAMVLVAKQLNNTQFIEISNRLKELKKEKASLLAEPIQQIIEVLSERCTQYRQEIRTLIRKEKKTYENLYNSKVFKLEILIIKINEDLFPMTKVTSALENFCYYNVYSIDSDSSELSEKIVKSDAVVFTSTYSPDIHNQVKVLQAYKKPGIILVPLNGEAHIDRVSLRHGNQLQKAGYHVIIKSFTPVRLFSSIDKEFLRKQLEN